MTMFAPAATAAEEEAAKERASARASAAREIGWDDLVVHGNVWLEKPTGLLWSPALSAMGKFNDENVCFSVGPSGRPTWLRVGRPFATLAEEESAEQAQADAAKRAEAERVHGLRAARKRAVTYADVFPDEVRPLMRPGSRSVTLAQAVDVLARQCCDLRVVDGHLVIEMPEGLPYFAMPSLLAACRYLYAADRYVVEELSAGRELPDVEITPSGCPIRPARRALLGGKKR
jgi:hypothetical protein